MRQQQKNRQPSPMWVFENNYRKLLQLFPDLIDIAAPDISIQNDKMALRVTVQECSRYTTTIAIKHSFKQQTPYLVDMAMKVRIYYDAQVAEVISYQGQHRFEGRYDYPNPQMRHRDEKRQLNQLLQEWLDYCLTDYDSFTVEPVLVQELAGNG